MRNTLGILATAVLVSACGSGSTMSGNFLSGEQNDTTSIRGGRPAVLHFWTDDCASCEGDDAILQSAQTQYAEFAFVSIYVGDDVAAARAAWRGMGDPYPLLADKNSELWQGYEVSVLPTTVFLDADGRVISRTNGPLDAAEAVIRLQEIRDLAAN